MITTTTTTDPTDIYAGAWAIVDDGNDSGVDILVVDDPETGERTFDLDPFGAADVIDEGVAAIRLTRETAAALVIELGELLSH